jgi:sugar phosphate isomerase/epimerase
MGIFMFKNGLVSISFRPLPPEKLIELCVNTGLDGIEWGGDIHVPHGNIAIADKVGKMTIDAGLQTAAYGSYYKAATSEAAGLSFKQVVDSARHLGAPTIRVWAGGKGSADTTAEERKAVVADLKRINRMAQDANMTISLEFHCVTLTDTNVSALQLVEELNGTGIMFYWQPPTGATVQYCLEGLTGVLPVLSNIHAFHWTPERRPLVEGIEHWKQYLTLAASDGKDRYVMLEFFLNDFEGQFYADAAILKELTGRFVV